MKEDLHNTCERAIGHVITSFGNPEMDTDPSESAEQAAQLSNGLRQAAPVYQAAMQKIEDNEREQAMIAAERQDLLNFLQCKSVDCHGDRFLLACNDNDIDVSYSRDGKKITREEAQTPFLTAYKIMRDISITGKTPDRNTGDLMVSVCEAIDKTAINYKIKRKDGSTATYTHKSLTQKLPEAISSYLKFIHFCSWNKTDIDDINALQKFYANNQKSIRAQELASLSAVMALSTTRMGPPLKDPHNRTTPWSKLIPGLQRVIPGFEHMKRLPVRLDLVLPFLAQSGYSLYSKKYNNMYTAQDLLLLQTLPDDLMIRSLRTHEEYSLRQILHTKEFLNSCKDKQAASENEDEFNAWLKNEYHFARACFAVQEANRQKIQEHFDENRIDMIERRKYEQNWLQMQNQLHRQEETRKQVIGEFSLDANFQTFAEAWASFFDVRDYLQTTGTYIAYADGSVSVQEQYEVNDPDMLMARPDRYSETASHAYAPAGVALLQIIPPIIAGWKESSRKQLDMMQAAAIQALQEHEQEVAQSNERDEREMDILHQAHQAGTYGATFG